MFVSYLRTFARMGLKAIPMEAETGPIGGDLSHEFIILADTGETDGLLRQGLPRLRRARGDRLRWRSCGRPEGRGLLDQVSTPGPTRSTIRPPSKPRCRRAAGYEGRGIEVGHIFYFGTSTPNRLGALVSTPDDQQVAVHSGSYGIGVSRLVGGIIEASHDENGIIWPESVAPFKVGLINLKVDDQACTKACEDLYGKLRAPGVEVLYDDTDERGPAPSSPKWT